MEERKRHSVSRRQALSLAGISMAVATVRPAGAQTRDPRTDNTLENHASLEDPRTKYPRPPFRRQPQPWPGLTS